MPADLDQPQTGRFVGAEHRFPVRVYTEDTDAGGVVYHANYLRFMERARSDMLWQAGADYVAEIAAGTGAYVVAEARLRFRAPARLGEALVIASRLTAVRAAAAHIQQRVMRGADLLVEGEVVAAYVTADGRAQRQPAAWRDAFRALLAADGMDGASDGRNGDA